jgi:hypothetical protein
MKLFDETIEIDAKQFGGISGTTNVIAEMVHLRYKANSKLESYVNVLMVDFSNSVNHIDHHLLLEML